jgi:hypothetical protein
VTDVPPPAALIDELENLLVAGREQQRRIRQLLADVVARIEAADRPG